MKYALISPIEPRETGYRVLDVEAQPFEVAPPYFWHECNDTIEMDKYWFNPSGNTFVAFPPPEILPLVEPVDPTLTDVVVGPAPTE